MASCERLCQRLFESLDKHVYLSPSLTILWTLKKLHYIKLEAQFSRIEANLLVKLCPIKYFIIWFLNCYFNQVIYWRSVISRISFTPLSKVGKICSVTEVHFNEYLGLGGFCLLFFCLFYRSSATFTMFLQSSWMCPGNFCCLICRLLTEPLLLILQSLVVSLLL